MIKEISYGIVPIRSGKVLLLRVYDTWDFPKGKPEAGEQPINTACRELVEESALSNPEFTWGTEYAESLPYKRGRKVARYFIASCPHGDVKLLPNPETGIVEHHDFAWLSIEDARLRVKERLYPVIDRVARRMGYEQQSAEASSGKNSNDSEEAAGIANRLAATGAAPADDE